MSEPLPSEAEEARGLIEARLRSFDLLSWDEMDAYGRRTEEVTTPSGRRFELTSVAFWDMEAWESGMNIEAVLLFELRQIEVLIRLGRQALEEREQLGEGHRSGLR